MSNYKNTGLTIVYPNDVIRQCDEMKEQTGSFMSLFRFKPPRKDWSTFDRVFLNLQFHNNQREWVTMKVPIFNYTYICNPIDQDREFPSSMSLSIPCDHNYYRSSTNSEERLGQLFKLVAEVQSYLIAEEFRQGKIKKDLVNGKKYLAAWEAINPDTGDSAWWGIIQIKPVRESKIVNGKKGRALPITDDTLVDCIFHDGDKTDFTIKPRVYVPYTILNEETGEEDPIKCGNIHKWTETGMILKIAYIIFDTVSISTSFHSGKPQLVECLKMRPSIADVTVEDDELDDLFMDTSVNVITNANLVPLVAPMQPVTPTTKPLVVEDAEPEPVDVVLPEMDLDAELAFN